MRELSPVDPFAPVPSLPVACHSTFDAGMDFRQISRIRRACSSVQSTPLSMRAGEARCSRLEQKLSTRHERRVTSS
eukprot:6206337-Pleurochrysis_carterae.AAC.2